MDPLNLPNLLTASRVIASFFLLFCGLQRNWEAAFWLFGFAALTDMMDGALARLLRQRTRLGAFLDPMADKLLMFFSFLILTLGGWIPWFLTGLVIARDLFITLGVFYLRFKKIRIVYRPTYLSKMTTLFQIVTVLSAFWLVRESIHGTSGDFFQEILPVLIGITTLLTAVTGIQYYRIGKRMAHAN